MAILSSKSFELDTPQSRTQKGPLIRVEISPGRFVKMYEQDAVAQGLVKPKQKKPGGNKLRRPQADKQGSGGAGEQGSNSTEQTFPGEEPEADDLTTIAGVGPATARALQARGLMTFEQLRQADLAILPISPAVKQAIEQWRELPLETE